MGNALSGCCRSGLLFYPKLSFLMKCAQKNIKILKKIVQIMQECDIIYKKKYAMKGIFLWEIRVILR